MCWNYTRQFEVASEDAARSFARSLQQFSKAAKPHKHKVKCGKPHHTAAVCDCYCDCYRYNSVIVIIVVVVLIVAMVIVFVVVVFTAVLIAIE